MSNELPTFCEVFCRPAELEVIDKDYEEKLELRVPKARLPFTDVLRAPTHGVFRAVLLPVAPRFGIAIGSKP